MYGIMAAELAQCVTGDSNWPGENRKKKQNNNNKQNDNTKL